MSMRGGTVPALAYNPGICGRCGPSVLKTLTSAPTLAAKTLGTKRNNIFKTWHGMYALYVTQPVSCFNYGERNRVTVSETGLQCAIMSNSKHYKKCVLCFSWWGPEAIEFCMFQFDFMGYLEFNLY